MEKSIIKTHNFENAKNKIQRFASQQHTDVALPSYRESGGLFGLGDHYINGTEMNEFTKKIQTHLIDSNNAIRKLIVEFNDVYDAFEALDKDYIQGILASVLAAEKASNEAKAASSRAEDAQKDIRRTIEALKLTVSKLSDFKNSINSEISSIKRVLEHSRVPQNFDGYLRRIDSLGETQNLIIDETDKLSVRVREIEQTPRIHELNSMFSSIENIRLSLNQSKYKVEILTKGLSSIEQNVNCEKINLTKKIDDLCNFRKCLEQTKHLWEIDSIWNEVKDCSSHLNHLGSSLRSLKEETENGLRSASIFQDRLKKLKHILDVDKIWDKIETTEHELIKSIDSIMDLHSSHVTLSQNLSTYVEQYRKQYSIIEQSLKTLTKHKDRIDSLSHIYDIDVIWGKAAELSEQLSDTQSTIRNYHTDYVDLEQRFERSVIEMHERYLDIEQNLSVLNQYKASLECVEHLPEVDTLWNDTLEHKKKLSQLDCEMNKVRQESEKSLNILFEFKDKLSKSSHLYEIDEMWNQIEYLKEKVAKTQEDISSLQKSHLNLEQEYNYHKDEFKGFVSVTNKQIVFAYITAGIGMLLTILNILNVF